MGFYKGLNTGIFDTETQKAYRDFINISNFENKLREDGYVWPSVLRFMREQVNHAAKQGSQS